jgi:predicted nucleic acid-binding Zn ribbon protein
MQKFSDDPIKVCPTCQAANVKKLVSATSFVLKGGGWYKDHYGLKSGGGDSGGSTDAPASTTSTPAAAPAAAAPAAAPAASAPAAPASGTK